MKLAVTCAMNQNRSMQTHDLLAKKGIPVKSFGTNPVIKLPGETMDKPNVYNFGVTYQQIYDDLCMKNEDHYRESGILYLLERNMGVKERPENFFQRSEDFDLVITCEERVFTSIFEYYADAPSCTQCFFMVNFDIRDTPSDAIAGAQEILEFVEDVLAKEEERLEYAVDSALRRYFERKGVMLLFTVVNL
ncbi:SSU72 PROTEIN HOMOLOG [Encephalitozoon cuniculi GB-M1]|uniref:RNA polymerase II subunit A C-terminal domain phosphatase SSU72 n=2 Tax=Encephalitozoon cuniculi TaxID=6035 RepID=Q8SRQ6_ENCCU|nr:RNA polymerase II subunit A C-terminal domain phosphatase [Encephalitozoon cuniculi GB-M1]KMV65978.1 Ssu72-like RNA polymerase II-interactingprotein [Encephalitozoon cuniculi EcunIII-L]UYI27675.1 RNA polymerase II subunit A C-terminal domain phosphatase SSU72 [Encephalitozoon cuniculi]CAD25444.2 SSU72 PROTEIN HOMOLOG [Encephalitozoon cuniculi GB-M1]